jgi:hypothetical protein
MMVDPGETEIGKGQAPQTGSGVIGTDDSGTDVVEELA